MKADTEICPACNTKLDSSTRMLNPRPNKVVEYGTTQTIELELTEHSSVQKNEPTEFYITNEEEEAVVKVTKNTNIKTVLLLLSFICILLLVIAVYCVMIINNDSHSVTTTTEYYNNDQLKYKSIISKDQLALRVIDVEPISIIIDGDTFVANICKCFENEDSTIRITESKIVIDESKSKLYNDEQELSYQMMEDTLKDVKYVGDVFCYDYGSFIQYGLYEADALYLFEIAADLDSEAKDNLALEYFESLRGIK